MANRDLTITLRGNVDDMLRAFKAAQGGGELLGRELTKIERDQAKLARAAERAAQKQRDAMTSVGTGVAAFGAAMLAGLGLATKAAMDWESAWAGVTKTVDGSAPQMAALEDELRQLAKELPATHQEIAAVAEAAGALGIKRENIIEFTRTMIGLGTATDLSADQAANALARISNVMGTSQDDVGRFGAALVELGNNGASTESEIVAMAQRIAGAGKQIGLSEGEVLGFASALSSVGIEAEAGGSAISTFFIKMATAVNEGGADLNNFATVAGMSADEFATKFRDDAGGAATLFVEGLGKIQASGGDTFTILDTLGLSEIRLRDAMLRLAGAGDLLHVSLDTGNRAWGENSALVEEVAKRLGTTESQMLLARNRINDFAINVGEVFLPIMGEASAKVGGFIDYLSSLPAPVQQSAAVLGGLVGVVSLLGGGAMIAVPKMVEFRNTLDDLGPKGQAVGRGLSRVSAILTGPWGLAIGGGVLALGAFLNRKAEAAAAVRQFTDAIESDSGALGVNTRALVVHQLEEEGFLKQAQELGIPVGLLTEAIMGNAAAHAEVTRRLDEQRSSFKPFNTEIVELEQAIRRKSGTINESEEAHRREQEAMAAAQGGHVNTAAAAEIQTEAQGQLNVEMDDGTTTAERLKAGLDGLTATNLTADEAALRYLDTVHRATEGIAQHGAVTDINTEAGRQNREALLGVAQAAQGELVAMLDAGAGVDDVRARHLFHREELIRVAQQMGFTGDEARRLTDRYLGVPGSIDTVFTAHTLGAIDAVHRFRDDVNNTMVSIRDADIRIQFGDTGNINRYARARGGPIFGPGTETSDDIPAWLSTNEHVWTAQEVRGAGGHANVARLRKMAAAGQIPGFARGGAVLREDVALNFHATGLEQVKANYARFIKDHLAVFLAGPGPGSGVERWRGVGLSALGITGQSPMHIGRLLMQMASESGGNPTIVNRWDSNWRKGTPSVGLMQVIGPTYRAHRHPAYDTGPYLYGTSVNPLSNVLAATRYTLARYGSLPAGWRGHGYDQGGIWGPGPGWNGSGRPERVLSPRQTVDFERLVDVLGTIIRPQLGAVREAAPRPGATITIGPVHLADRVDVDLLADRLAFKATTASFG